ncbi:hypothetical protein E2C01_035465 [Portunus trituberculatus]|uniref:Uncharacterized protein n=1 Tax=Portunus trituberculatus TaxID=210409 RepID=A0A5B7F9E7_PORTR|nr:hypothetical protein [Portunus trituberculatus]
MQLLGEVGPNMRRETVWSPLEATPVIYAAMVPLPKIERRSPPPSASHTAPPGPLQPPDPIRFSHLDTDSPSPPSRACEPVWAWAETPPPALDPALRGPRPGRSPYVPLRRP